MTNQTETTESAARAWPLFHVKNGVFLAPRPIHNSFETSKPGIGDRLRTAAFAEMQAEAAFSWAADFFHDAPEELRRSWRGLAKQEEKHLNWLLKRMQELEITIQERPVSDVLWQSLVRCTQAREFCHYMADAEERGRRAGVCFHEKLKPFDPISAEIFHKIAEEEKAHIALSYRFFPLVSEVSLPSKVLAQEERA